MSWRFPLFRKPRSRNRKLQGRSLRMESLERRDLLAVVDLTPVGTQQGTFNGAIFTDADIGGAGAGNLVAFVSIQNTGTEQGYNSSFRPVQFNESNSPQQNQDLPLSSVPVINIGGVAYREFVLDTNEIAGDLRFISLNKLEIYQSPAGGLNQYPFTDGTGPVATKVYDMDAGTAGTDTAAPSPNGNWVFIDNEQGPGGGNANVYVYVPNAAFAAGGFVTLYSQFGVTASTDDGPEEWGVRTFEGGVSGRKFHDLDGDGTDDGGTDPGLPGWTIYIDANNNGQHDPGEVSTTTAADGTYSFGNLAPGAYVIREVLQAGWAQTFPAAGFHGVEVEEVAVGNIDFGNVQTASISGQKFDDLDGDGIKDPGEGGIAGVTIQLDLDADGTVDATAVTDASGNYSFTDLTPGVYRVREVVPAGRVQTTLDPADIVLTSGSSVTDVDFGNFALITISGQKFDDLDGDGVKDPGEPGIAGVTITLDLGADGSIESTTVTDALGNYSFGPLGPGVYRIREIVPAGRVQTTLDPADIAAVSGMNVTDIDFGNVETLTISGQKFDDLDGDGIKDLGEPGIGGVTITLDIDADGTVDATTVTDGGGNYQFTGLQPGVYRVREIVPAGRIQTTLDPADIMAISGTDVTGIDFGNFELITISGQKFDDLNGDGVKDPGEPGIGGVTITLDVNADGTVDSTTVTDAGGNYQFTNLLPGVYRIREIVPAGRVQTTLDPADITAISGTDVTDIDFGNFELISISGQKFDDLSGDGIKDPGEGGIAGVTITLDIGADGIIDNSTVTDASGNYQFTNLGPGVYRVREIVPAGRTQTTLDPADITALSGTDVTDIDFGNTVIVATASISGQKFDDLNGDGIKDPGEPGIAGVTIQLDVDADGTVDATTLTDAGGNYSFTELPPGVYRVREVVPAGRVQTTLDPADIVLDGEDVTDIDFGNFELITIGGLKFNDINGNGVQDPGELGIQGVTITLDIGADGTVNDSTITDASGNYQFINLGPGVYRIREIVPAGRVQTTPNPADIVATSGTDVTGVDFGNRVDLIIVGPDKTNSSLPFVHLVNPETGEVVRKIQAYELSYRGGVRVATGDLNGDGIAEIIVAPGRNRPPLIKIFDQQGNLLKSFLAYGHKFKGGVDVAVGDVNGDGRNDIVTAMSYGGNVVKVFRNTSGPVPIPYPNLTFSVVSTFQPFGSKFKGGATVAVADMGTAYIASGKKKFKSYFFDGKAEVIVGNEAGMRSTVKLYTYHGASSAPTLVRKYLPFDAKFRGGLSLEVARVNGDVVPDIIVGAGNGGRSRVQVIHGANPNVTISQFQAFTQAQTPSFNAPIDLAAIDGDGDGIAECLWVAQGTDGTTRELRKFNPLSGDLVDTLFENDPDFFGAYFLAGLNNEPADLVLL